MSKKWKILGYQTNIEWYDIKTKFKLLLRKITYSWAFQELICFIIIGYVNLVFFTSKKIYINFENFSEPAKNKQPFIAAIWHNRLMLSPFFVWRTKKLYRDSSFMALASRHGDGQFISKIMQKFGAVPILGSTRDGRKSTRGIDIGNFRRIFTGLKSGNILTITPDGPRGPNQKINGEIVNIARLAQAGILPVSYSTSRFTKLKTWDQFYIPFPFSTICFYCHEKPFYVDYGASDAEIADIKNELELQMNLIQEKSQEIATQSRK